MGTQLIEHSLTVDVYDNVVGIKPRAQIDSTDIYRAAATWITNEFGEIFTVRRPLDKKKDPGKWSVAMSGTLSSADRHTTMDPYEHCMRREFVEELGTSYAVPMHRMKHFLQRPDGSAYWQVDNVHFPRNTVFSILEGIDGKWISAAQARDEIAEKPDDFTPYFRFYFDYFHNHVPMGPGDIRVYGEAWAVHSPRYLPNPVGRKIMKTLTWALRQEKLAQQYAQTYRQWEEKFGEFCDPRVNHSLEKKLKLQLAA